MAGQVIVVYAGQQPPESWDACVFIEGSAPRSTPIATPWQSEVLTLLRERWTSDGRLVVFVPEPSNRASDAPPGELIDWYDRALDVADVVMFWWPDDTDQRLVHTSLAALTDNKRMVLGVPPQGPRGRHLLHYAHHRAISTATTLDGMVNTVLDKIGPGARRFAGEREIPLPVWRTSSFQRWYSAQTSAGNTVLGARLVWAFNTGPHRGLLLYWALHVRMYVLAEDRVKSNE